MSEYFPRLKPLAQNGKAKLDLSNYERKVNLKKATGVDTSDFCSKMI